MNVAVRIRSRQLRDEAVSGNDLFRAIDRAMDHFGRALWEGVRSSPHRDRSFTRLGRVAVAAGQGG
jgi:hypothetical protein